MSTPLTPGAGPFHFQKTLHVTNTGSITNLGTAGITLNIDNTVAADRRGRSWMRACW